MTQDYFFQTIQALRQHEEILLYQNIWNISEREESDVLKFLEQEYLYESLSYPNPILHFDAVSALWSAKIVYYAAQLILYRQQEVTDLESLFQRFLETITAEKMLSADLCLRFLPNIIFQLKMIDSSDKLIEILENILEYWHYSGINYPLDIDKLNWDNIQISPSLMQLYTHRVIEYKRLALAQHTVIKPILKANLGMYADDFWKDFKTTIIINDGY